MDKAKLKYILNIEKSTRQYLYGLNQITQERDIDGKFHPSGLGYCTRKLQYHYLGENVIHKISSGTRSIFDLGHAIHEMLQDRLEKVLRARFRELEDFNYLLLVEESINQTEFAKDQNLAGSADGVIKIFSKDTEDLLVTLVYEAKSISSKGWSKLSSPLIKHRMQASVYAKCFDAPFILFEYYCKDNSKSKWFLIERDDEALQGALNQIGRVVRATDKLELVPQEGSSYECGDCPYLETCLPEGVPV